MLCWLAPQASFHRSASQDCRCQPCCCTIAQVLEKLVANRLHRLYVVDSELRPIGIVTLTDILRVVTQQSIG